MNDGLQLLGVAIDADPDRARAFNEEAGCEFAMAVDTRNLLHRVLGVKTVTNAFLLDERQVLRWQHLHGFRIVRPEMRAMAERVVAGDLEEILESSPVRQESLDVEVLRGELSTYPESVEYTFMLAEMLCQQGEAEEARQLYQRCIELDPADSTAYYALGSLLAADGDNARATEVWRRALDVDPMNFTVRKQIWRLEHPEKFYPDIDMEFQVEQIKKEGFPDLSKLPISIRRELELEEG